MDSFLETHYLPRLIQHKIENANRTIMNKKLSNPKSLNTENPESDGSLVNSTKY